MRRELTDKQKYVLAYIETYICKHGYAPTVREIGKGVHLTVATVHGYLKRLEKAGVIQRKQGSSRAIKVV